MLHRDVITAATAIYSGEWVWSQTLDMYGNNDSSIPATFEIVNFIGWKPHTSQVCIGIFVVMCAEIKIQFIHNHFPYIVRK